MPDSPYLVELLCPENAPATTILPNGQHYTRELDPTTGGLATKITCWDHDVEAMKAAGFRDPEEQRAAEAVHAQAQQAAEPAPEEQPAPESAAQQERTPPAAEPAAPEEPATEDAATTQGEPAKRARKA